MLERITGHGKSLREFQTPGTAALFSDAESFPEFFKKNLLDDARVIKVFRDDPQANIRVFYYQYLRLCFEIEHPDVEAYISKV